MLEHRSVEAIYYFIKKEYYWIGMKKDIEEVLSKCEICIINNIKRKLDKQYICTSIRLEKMGIDILHLTQHDCDILVTVDYFSRYVAAEKLENRTFQEILNKLDRILEKLGKPEIIISDNAKEIVSSEFSQWCEENEIVHKPISIEAHGSNGRVERVLRTIKESTIKKC